jgi:hypothetical protein
MMEKRDHSMNVKADMVVEAARQVVASLKGLFLDSLRTAAEKMTAQAKLIHDIQILEAQETALTWLVQHWMEEEKKLLDAGLPPFRKAFIERKLALLDAEISALRRAAGVNVTTTSTQPRTRACTSRVPPPSRN